MRYPVELVHRFGAKAGILMYVKQQLPDIPQVDMIVKTPDESVDDALRRADEYPILYPRIYRSSAVAELDGYEGDFPSVVVKDFSEMRRRITNPNYIGEYSSKDVFDRHVRKTIEDIQKSPKWLKEDDPKKHGHLPDDIRVIIAKKSPSSLVGTYIKHPNQDGFYIISLTISETVGTSDPLHAYYLLKRGKLEGIGHYSDLGEYHWYYSKEAVKRIHDELNSTVVPWHDKIAGLPEMDGTWTYQIEFGLDPASLYQVRPFKPVQRAEFALRSSSYGLLVHSSDFVIGVTPREGINVRVEKDLWDRHCKKEPINPDNQPSVFFNHLRSARDVSYLPNHQANIFTSSLGILAHDDVKAIRQAVVNYVGYPYFSKGINQGDWINIVSDGRNMRVRKLKTVPNSMN